MVLKKVEDLNLTIDEKNIADEGVMDELVEKGGKGQTPFMIDPETGTFMYESGPISEYLEKNYGSGMASQKGDTTEPNVCMLE